MGDAYRHALHWFDRLDKQEWLLLMAAAVVLGFFALRGFGSRSNY